MSSTEMPFSVSPLLRERYTGEPEACAVSVGVMVGVSVGPEGVSLAVGEGVCEGVAVGPLGVLVFVGVGATPFPLMSY